MAVVELAKHVMVVGVVSSVMALEHIAIMGNPYHAIENVGLAVELGVDNETCRKGYEYCASSMVW